MKKILITGCNGFIGNHLVKFYKAKKYMIYGIDISLKYADCDNVNYYKFDLESENISELYKSINPDYFIHCAGNASVGISVDHPELDFEKNVGVLYKTLSALKRAEIKSKFIFLSSAAVYGNPSILPISEISPTLPVSPYGLHKKICEDICEYYREMHSMEITVVRIFSAYGEGLRKQLLWDIYNKYKHFGYIELFGTGHETRDFIHIDDLIQSIDIILNSKDVDFIYNIANGEETSIKQISEIYATSLAISNDKVSFNGKIKVGDPLNWRADITRLKKLGYKQSVDLREGLKNYIDWVKKIVRE